MRLGYFEDYVWRNTPVRNGWTQAWLQDKVERRNLSLIDFPYCITVKAGWDELEELESWIIPYLGQQDGRCDQYACYYPSCPDYLYFRTFVDFENSLDDLIPSWTFDTGAWVPSGDNGEIRCDRTWHEHSGVWKVANPIKTGYDYGLCDFLFKHEKDFDLFRSILPVYLSKHQQRCGEQQ
jgi:hypothetical protein